MPGGLKSFHQLSRNINAPRVQGRYPGILAPGFCVCSSNTDLYTSNHRCDINNDVIYIMSGRVWYSCWHPRVFFTLRRDAVFVYFHFHSNKTTMCIYMCVARVCLYVWKCVCVFSDCVQRLEFAANKMFPSHEFFLFFFSSSVLSPNSSHTFSITRKRWTKPFGNTGNTLLTQFGMKYKQRDSAMLDL